MKIFLILISVLMANTALGADTENKISVIQENSRLTILEDRVEEVRRDQLNYTIEKDLLKNTYSSNLETVNTIITIVLGVFAVLGFLGVRSISSLRDQFKSELVTFQTQRTELDRKLAEMEAKQEEVDVRMESVTEVTNHQDIRLEVLEIQEKVSSLIRQKNPTRALHYIAVGLDSASDDIVLLIQKLQCYWMLGRFEDAVDVTELLITTDEESNKAHHILNLMELYLLLERFDSFNEVYSSHKRDIEKTPYLPLYFMALRQYLLDGKEQFIESIVNIIDKVPAGKNVASTWRYDEARIAIADKPDTMEKNILLKVFEVLEGKADKEELIKMMPDNRSDSDSEPTVDDSVDVGAN